MVPKLENIVFGSQSKAAFFACAYMVRNAANTSRLSELEIFYVLFSDATNRSKVRRWRTEIQATENHLKRAKYIAFRSINKLKRVKLF